MDILIEEEEHLILSWYPGCYFSGLNSCGCPEYILGDIGRTGCSYSTFSSEPKVEQGWTPKISSALQFTIKVKRIDGIELYDKVLSVIEKLQKTDQIKVDVTRPYVTRTKLEPKEEYKQLVEEMTESNAEIVTKYQSLVEKLEVLGCDCDDIGAPTLKSIPDEYYDWKIHTDATRGSINVCCHSGTEFYKFLNENNLLEKYMPEWYRKGDF